MSALLLNRRTFLLGTGAALAAGPAHADYIASVRAQLEAQGYSQISVSSTMLGRSRIVAKSRKGAREIIMNPRTGEILRDVWTSAAGSQGPAIVGNNDDSVEDSDDADDDDSDDDRDDDGDSDRDNEGDDGGGDDGGSGDD